MHEISHDEVLARIRADNPWWIPPHRIPADWRGLEPRLFLQAFLPLFQQRDPHRAVVLLGARRVGKTVLLHHAIQRSIEAAASPSSLCYVSLDTPLYTGLPLETLLRLALDAAGLRSPENACIIFDEIQYHADWERHLKSLVDTYRSTRFVASGSAAAALKLKSDESGAGRFTDFLLPPLTFVEYLVMTQSQQLFGDCLERFQSESVASDEAEVVERLNTRFVEYINLGGFPEAIVSEPVRRDPARFIRQDVIDKVLLRDLPSLYGIQDIQELNRLFNVLAWNTGQEISLDELSRGSGVSKNTIRKYLDYLRAAFLIEIIDRIDRSGRRFQRATSFKVYLTNPSMRAALYQPETADGPRMGSLVETALLAQESGETRRRMHYARWGTGSEGEVDFVELGPDGRVGNILEVKWSDGWLDRPSELKGLLAFCNRGVGKKSAVVTSRTRRGRQLVQGIELVYWPASFLACTTGSAHVFGEKIRRMSAAGDAAQKELQHHANQILSWISSRLSSVDEVTRRGALELLTELISRMGRTGAQSEP